MREPASTRNVLVCNSLSFSLLFPTLFPPRLRSRSSTKLRGFFFVVYVYSCVSLSRTFSRVYLSKGMVSRSRTMPDFSPSLSRATAEPSHLRVRLHCCNVLPRNILQTIITEVSFNGTARGKVVRHNGKGTCTLVAA